MLRLGLTGSIATGKSTALKAFADLGVPVFSSDEAVHDLYRGDAMAPVEMLFPGVVRDGAIDRTELSRRLVAEPARLAELEAAVHPLVRAKMAEFLDRAQQSGAKLAVVDIPLLYETGFDYGLDKVAVTWCDPDTQRRRALRRPAMTVEKLEAILARQMPQDEKKKRADYLFDTGQPVEAVRAQIQSLVEKLNAAP